MFLNSMLLQTQESLACRCLMLFLGDCAKVVVKAIPDGWIWMNIHAGCEALAACTPSMGMSQGKIPAAWTWGSQLTVLLRLLRALV